MNKLNQITVSLLILIILLGFVIGTVILNFGQVYANSSNQTQSTHRVFLPIITNPPPRQVLLGVYTDHWLGFQSTIDNEITAIGTWSGKRISIAGIFIGFEDPDLDKNIPNVLGRVWDSGYTPLVNMESIRTLAYINSGNLDHAIRLVARSYKKWRDDGLAIGQNRKAFFAPLQEMNGDWVPYYGTPADYKRVYQRIYNIFVQEGAASAVRWVFAPNGWSYAHDNFEYFYPGDEFVDVIAFSSYNFGYCPAVTAKSWTTPERAFGAYIQRMRAMAPSKPIFVIQTASSAWDASGFNTAAKNEWLRNAYNYLADSPGVAGIIYFNMENNQICDFAFYLPEGRKYDGYRQGVSRKEYVYLSPAELVEMELIP